MSLCSTVNIPQLGIRKAKLNIDERTHGSIGKALTLSTKRGTELAWRLSKENLNRSQRKELFEEIYGLCKESFSVEDSNEFRKDVKHHIFDTHEICIVPFGNVPEGLSPVCFKTDKIAAFASYSFLNYWKNKKVIYFSGIVVDPSLQGLRYGSLLIQEIMKINGTEIAVLRTQSSIMYNSFAKVCNVFPSLNDKKTSGEMKNIGEYVAKNILRMSDYNREEMIGRETYCGSLYGQEPTLNDPMVDRAFKEKINIDRGDSIIVVGKLK